MRLKALSVDHSTRTSTTPHVIRVVSGFLELRTNKRLSHGSTRSTGPFLPLLPSTNALDPHRRRVLSLVCNGHGRVMRSGCTSRFPFYAGRTTFRYKIDFPSADQGPWVNLCSYRRNTVEAKTEKLAPHKQREQPPIRLFSRFVFFVRKRGKLVRDAKIRVSRGSRGPSFLVFHEKIKNRIGNKDFGGERGAKWREIKITPLTRPNA